MEAKLALLLSIACCGFCDAIGNNNYGLFLFGLDDLKKDKVKDDPKPCCIPETWQGFVQTSYGTAEKRGKTNGGFVTTEMFVDGQKKRVAGKVMFGCPMADFTFAGFYNESSGQGFRLYSYKTVNATKCWSHYWDKFHYEKPCLPANSTFMGEMKLGLKSSGWAVNAFRFSDRRGSYGFKADMLVTKEACVPVAFREIGSFGGRPHGLENDEGEDDEKRDPEGVPQERLLFTPTGYHARPKPRRGQKKFVVSALYNDLEPQIKDEKVFDLPDICKKNPDSYPLNLDDVTDPLTREGFENLEAILEYIVV